MKATELKVGDWVYSYNPWSNKTRSVHVKGIRDGLIIVDNDFPNKPEEIAPIPLTKEILEKNGWKKKDGKYIDEDNGLILKPSRGLFLFFMQSGGTQDICMLLNDITYIHELQHLLWALGIDDNLKIWY